MKIYLLMGLFLSFASQGAVKIRHGDDVAQYRSEVMQLGARLSSLEKEIGSKNNLYIQGLEKIKLFEGEIKSYQKRLAQIRTEVQQTQQENKRILTSYLIEMENEGTEAWQKRVHLELLKRADLKLKAKESELIGFENRVVEFSTKLNELKQNEEELAVLIRELEERKKVAMELYQKKLHLKKVSESKIQAQKFKHEAIQVKKSFGHAPVVEVRPDRLFRRPLEDYVTFTPSSKGVTFRYQSIQPIKAVAPGKVVYAGDLASYGQVLMIDHGRDLRTVLLGSMNLKVKKNDSVQDGDILAYTQVQSQEAQNLYFEVRKKNTAQNTILWLDQNGVSKI
jgi:septal ring factor EnvC (AmiA/AmiB activator)